MAPLLRAIKVLGGRPAIEAGRIRRFMQGNMRGFYTTRAILALFNVGLLDELNRKGAVDIVAFAEAHNLDARMLESLCNYLYEVKVLQRGRNRCYALNRHNRAVTEALNGPFYSVYAYQDVFHNLEALLQKEKVYGRDITRNSEYVAKGSGAAGKLFAFPMVADTVQRQGYNHVLDLGCGDATFLLDLCQRNVHLHAYGLDIAPEAIADGKRYVAEAGMADRVELVVGDIFEIDQLAGRLQGIDAAISVYVLHEFHAAGDDCLVDLFRRFKSGFPGVPLIICEVIRHSPQELRRRPGGAMEIQLWHDLSHQTLLSRDEWRSLFRRAGFTDIQEDYLGFARTAIFTVR